MPWQIVNNGKWVATVETLATANTVCAIMNEAGQFLLGLQEFEVVEFDPSRETSPNLEGERDE